MKKQILSALSPEYPWKDMFHYLPETDSTNVQLKAMARQGAPHGTVVIAGRQTGGKGRLGRTFHSPENAGVYLSILIRPNCAPGQLMHLTCAAAVAMCDAIEQAAGIRAGIKWTNDLVYGKRKLGGILTELGFSPDGKVDWVIVGIGIMIMVVGGMKRWLVFLGFGGVGESGMGGYHGKVGFDTFTHYKSIVDKKTWLDLPMRYQPYKKIYEKIIRLVLG